MASKRLLVVFAHPDDESFGAGGLIAKYGYEGVEVSYICATKGDRGTVKPEYLEKYGSIEAVRDAELDCAAQVLGFKHVFKLGYRDSDMMGSANNHDPDCLWQADESKVVGEIVQIIREVRPQVVLTFDPYGGYGHPDHIFVHRAATKAFAAAGDAAQYPDSYPAYAPQKLYYMTLPRNLLRAGIWLMRLTWKNPRQFGENKDIDMIEVLNHIPPTHTRIDIGDWLDVWDKAARCHASQGGGGVSMVPRWLRRWVMGWQRFNRHYPTPQPGARLERDLFEGVRID